MSEQAPSSDHETALRDIAIRVRGYTRYLAVAEDDGKYPSQSTRRGVYRLPEEFALQHPYIVAEASYCGDHEEWLDLLLDEDGYSLSLSDQPVYENGRHFTILAGSESKSGVNIFDERKDGSSSFGEPTPSMATKVLRLLNQLDPLIPSLRPDSLTRIYADTLSSRFHDR